MASAGSPRSNFRRIVILIVVMSVSCTVLMLDSTEEVEVITQVPSVRQPRPSGRRASRSAVIPAASTDVIRRATANATISALTRLPSVAEEGFASLSTFDCKTASHLGSRVLPLGSSWGVSVACHIPRGSDVVCDALQKSGDYEPELSRLLLKAVGHYRSNPGETPLVFLDVGSNVGVMALAVWKRGISVVAVDVMERNTALLSYSTRCVNDALWEKNIQQRLEMHIHRVALGGPVSGGESKCAVLVEEDNLGDGRLECDSNIIRQLTSRRSGMPESYVVESWVHLASLDSFVQNCSLLSAVDAPPPIVVMKIDAEGSEIRILSNGRQWLLDASRRPKVLLMEMWGSLDAADVHRFGAMMIGDMSYIGLVVDVKARKPTVLSSPNALLDWQRSIGGKGKMGSVVWVVPEVFEIARKWLSW